MSFKKPTLTLDSHIKYDPLDPIFQKLTMNGQVLPGVWSYFLPPGFADLKVPAERRSTCMSCPKICEQGWRADYRCCTYHPRVANFSLGLALMTPEGEKGLLNAKSQGMLLPEGTTHSPQQYIDYLRDLEHDSFGKSQQVLCPMLEQETGYCRIHAFRNSVCSTFFCLKDHGDAGENFWSGLQLVVSQVEIALSQWCLTELGFDLKVYIKRMNTWHRHMGQVSDSKHRGFSTEVLIHLWAELYGREFELYQACAKLVMDYRDVLWEIANDVEILDARQYDLANLKHVPQELAHQIDEDDWDVSGQAETPQELWQRCLGAYEKLWGLPRYAVRLSKRVELKSEVGAEPALAVKKAWGQDEQEVVRLSRVEYGILQSLQQAQRLDWRFLSQPLCRSHAEVRGFLAEAWQQRLLVRG